jgi:hypothetical protein
MSFCTCCDPTVPDHMPRPAEKVKHARRSIGDAGSLVSRRVVARELDHARCANGSRAGKRRSREGRNRSDPRKGQGWGLSFRLPLRRFRRVVARIERSEIRERRSGSVAAPGFRSAQPGLRNLKEAERRQTQGHNRRISRCGARPFGARTLAAVPPRLSPNGVISSQRLSFRPGFLGLGLNGRYSTLLRRRSQRRWRRTQKRTENGQR